MGISSDGVLYFGFQVGGEEEMPEWLPPAEDEEKSGERMDFDDWVCPVLWRKRHWLTLGEN